MSTTHYVKYDLDGTIVSVETGPYYFLPCDEGVGDTTHYVDISGDYPEIRAKEPMDVTFSISGLKVVFTNLAIETVAQVKGEEVIVDDGGLAVEFDSPGTYEIRLIAPPRYLNETLEVMVG